MWDFPIKLMEQDIPSLCAPVGDMATVSTNLALRFTTGVICKLKNPYMIRGGHGP